MTAALKVEPKSDRIDTGVSNTASPAAGLKSVLADTYCLMFKTHAIHWNIEGPLFHAVHVLTEEQYENLFAAADELAERIRALGTLAPVSLNEMINGSVIEDVSTDYTAGDMVESLAQDHERLAKRMHALIELAGSANDPVTEDLATVRSAFHEKSAWMLRATAKSG